MELIERSDVEMMSNLFADIMKTAYEDYLRYRTVLYGIDKGELKYSDNEEAIRRSNQKIEESKRDILDNNLKVIQSMSPKDFLAKLEQKFESEKEELLKALIAKRKLKKKVT